MFKKFKDSLKYLKWKDIFAILLFLTLLIPSFFYKFYLKILKKELYLICEDPNEACDNGYHLFKYIRINYPEENVYYAINKKSSYYKKIEKYGNVIQFGSLKHWIYYLAATKNVSTHKYGNPNPPLFYVLHVMLHLFDNRVFLQHGITQNDSKWLYYKNTKFRNIISAAKPEYNYFIDKFGYPKANVKYIGFPRFDNLDTSRINPKQIVFMPSWRNWLGRDINGLSQKEEFIDTDYFKCCNSLLNNKKLNLYLSKNGITMYFFPHRNMQKFINNFKFVSENVKIVTSEEVDIQDLIIESSLMITDYSSVAFDFAYMKKPVFYYQFDLKEFQEKQLQPGYFSYKNNGFGEVVKSEDELVEKVIECIKNEYQLSPKYMKRINSFFEIDDNNNCERNYQNLKGDF